MTLLTVGWAICFVALVDLAWAESCEPHVVKDINQSNRSSAPSQTAKVNGTYFFAATDGIYGIELWKSDGTAAVTVMVKDINPETTPSMPRGVSWRFTA